MTFRNYGYSTRHIDLVTLKFGARNLARGLLRLGNLRSITTDCAFSSAFISRIKNFDFLQNIRLDQYVNDDLKQYQFITFFPAKIFLSLSILFPATNLIRLLFLLLAQACVQLRYLLYFNLLFPRNSSGTIVVCQDTGAFLIVAYKNIFRAKYKIYIEQCVSPRCFQQEAIKRCTGNQLSIYTRIYYKIMSMLESYEHLHAHMVICPSSIVKDQVVSLGVMRERVKLLPYPFELHIADNTQNITKPSDKPPKFLFVGNDILRKGLPSLLEAFELIENYDYELHVAGKFTISDIKKIYKHRLPSSLTVHGKLGTDDLYDLYRSCDVFISPSFCEGSPITILEAALFKNLIIASIESGCNFIPDTEYLPFDAGNTQQLVQHIRNYLHQPDLFSKISHLSHRAIEKRFSIQGYVDGLGEIF